MQQRLRNVVLQGLVLAVAGGIWSGAAWSQSGDKIRIGAMMALTGPAAVPNTEMMIGVRMAAKEINERGGIMGRQVELVVADDQFNPAQAVNEARRLVSHEKVQVMLGPTVSQMALAAAPVFTEAKILNVSSAASAALTPQLAPFHFSAWTSTEAQSEAQVAYAVDVLKAKSVAVLTDTGGQGKSAQEVFKRVLAARGVTLTGVQEHEPRVTDVTPQLLSLRRGNPEVILQVSTVIEDAALTVKTMQDLGWQPKVVSNVLAVLPQQAMKAAGPDIFKSGQLAGVTMRAHTYCQGQAVGGTEFGQFQARLKAFDSQNYEKLNPKSVGILYDGLFLIKAAVEATRSFDGATLRAWIEKNASSVKGINGTLAASASNHFLIGPDGLAVVTRPDVVRSDGLVQRLSGC
jgi:branched-chain amino acid transport system substrate-binding protein